MNFNTTLSLKLPPEVAKIMPWIIAAKKSGQPSQAAWAQRQHEIAQKNARLRECVERATQEWNRNQQKEAKLLEQLLHDFRKIDQEVARQDAHEYRLYLQGIDTDGFYMPAQSSQKGWRRILSESPTNATGGQNEWGCEWGAMVRNKKGGHRSRRNEGRKPRKPWFK